jgi:GMP synthase (glutamine-hydrolysing)
VQYWPIVKLLLLQARPPDDPMLDHERQCFVRACGVEHSAFTFRNVVEGVPSASVLDRHDALLVGGSGHFSVARRAEGFFGPLGELLEQVVERGFPTFASCFGFQLLVALLGGSVGSDPNGSEVGSFPVTLTEEGRKDPIFQDFPERFVVQQGHMDRILEPAPGVPNLAFSDRAPFQALRLPAKPIWATQFHPELDQRSNHERYKAYIAKYDPAAAAGELSDYRSLPSPEASGLLPKFLQHLRTF